MLRIITVNVKLLCDHESVLWYNLQKIKIKKSLLYCTRLIPFRVSRVRGAHLLDFTPGTTLQRLQRWRVVGNVWEI